ncbi:Pyruvate kinase, alpha/beta domain [Caprobacter fermentans]|uniref:Pyruvate kinase, alpha/beta domain n=1 Tax=Caproicibacter fermentans TaxID=2576756 RepID=A0A6N8I262_9FIRM|nr:pyruvate kinase alpha/beta domain-containing protein [Caproicibacter fermentans]MVB11603.1 Pyruvate kinase, alpha/beta domain [Caproicibacter fermentans]
MNNQICYFEKPGKSNTENVFKIVKEYALAHHMNEIVLASTTGQTALLAADYFHDSGIKIIAVGVDTFGWSQSEEAKNELRKKQIQAVPCVHYFEQDTANALRSFSQGTKVAFEIAQAAMENGLLSDINQIIAIGGTGFGSDTALILKSNGNQNPKFDVIRILCMPQTKQLDEKKQKNVF